MAIQGSLIAHCFLVLVALLLVQTECTIDSSFNRTSFPPGFLFGCASSAYQYEGSAAEDGRGTSIWDTFTHKTPGRIYDGSNGDIAIDFYRRYKEDVKLMKDMNLDAFRFSISWSRLLPNGKLSGGVNEKGIRFYNDLINELLSNGLQPFATLYHFDHPQALEDEYGGFLNARIADDFRDFSELCFKEFGDRVKYWTTLNEPVIYTSMGYDFGQIAPGRCSKWVNKDCQGGDSATEPYIVGHHMLLAHAAVVRVYRQNYQVKQNGKIGITLMSYGMVPYNKTKPNFEAAERALDFMLGWYIDPLVYGNYPFSMRIILGNRLPKFTEEEAEMINGSFDFIGLNYYSSYYAFNIPAADSVHIRYTTDSFAGTTGERNGNPIGAQASSWLYVYPKGLRDVLIYIKKKYNNPAIYITENGVSENNNASLTLNEALKDTMRIDYHHKHLLFLRQAISEGANVKGYFVWSLFDDFEWASGYSARFGMNFVDYKDGLKRYPKESATWFKNFLQE